MQYGAGWRPRRSENLASRRPHGQHASLTLDADAPSLEGALSSSLSLVCHSPPSISFQYEGCFRRMRESILRPSFPPSPFVQGEGCFSAKTAYQTDATSWPPGSGRASSVLAQPVVDLSFRLGLVVAIPLLQDTRKFFGLATQ